VKHTENPHVTPFLAAHPANVPCGGVTFIDSCYQINQRCAKRMPTNGTKIIAFRVSPGKV